MSSRLVTFRVPEDLYQDFQERCEKDGITVSERLRRFIDDLIYPITRPQPATGPITESDNTMDSSSEREKSNNTLEQYVHRLLRAVKIVNKRLYEVEKTMYEIGPPFNIFVDNDKKWEVPAKEVEKLCKGN